MLLSGLPEVGATGWNVGTVTEDDKTLLPTLKLIVGFAPNVCFPPRD